MESPNTSPKVVEPNPSCLGQAHPIRPGTDPGYKNTEPGNILTMLGVSFMICPLRSADGKSGKAVCTAGTNVRLDLSLSWRASENLLKKPYKI